MASTRASARLAEVAPVFAALGDQTRLRLIARLSSEGPQSISRLADGAKVTRQAITKHLRALEGVGLARSSRAGRERIWELRAKRLNTAEHYLEQISNQWDAVINRLRAFVESEE
ncbi:MAG TPA: metalloregulator ArsR/SmtB family transcription factor [Candidatus Binataceae bacterium]|nr:metalloregulator ArsR/SmtB family transcription factor [Candidatus Binataceae bacterium]